MCGRYANARHDGDLLRDLAISSVVDDPPPPSWNIAPTAQARVVLERLHDGEPDRQLRTLKWGLIPSWATDLRIAAKLFNARSETITTKPAFKAAAVKRRCLVPADGYYEWMVAEDGKHPMYLHGDGPLALAGLYELRPDVEDPERWLWTFTILTCTTADELGHIHDRSPIVVPSDLHGDWLDPAMTEPGGVRDLLAAIPPPRLHTYEVATTVNSARNDGPELIEPLTI
jgi:putative SOS response-associated peptidase YedK